VLPARYKQITKTVFPGGFGKAQVVLDTFLDRHVVFKSMQDGAHNGQLLAEITALSKARSRHVVEIYDVIRDKDGLVQGIIIELLKGRDYSSFHIEARSDPQRYVRVLYQIATALSDLHRAGVVHRDLKLENLKDSESGILKLFDFGISVAGDNYKTKHNRGSFVYAAPQLYEPEVEITPEMDIYAFGVCAWALATDKLPRELCERPPQRSGRAPSIDTAMPGLLHPEIVTLIDSALDPDPTQRPDAHYVSSRMQRHLVRGLHKGLLVSGPGAVFELSASKRNARVAIPHLGEVRIDYNDFDFTVTEVTGSVFINNERVTPGSVLHEACTLCFGDFDLKSDRVWVPFVASKPEVIL
jgi:serine/threonine-protein kinase